jgi:hypothetical protein
MGRDRMGVWLMVLALSGCVSAATRDPEEVKPAAQASSADAGLRTRALQALSEHLSRPPRELEVVSITPTDWPDSSLGCPKTDRSYRTVITPGHLAVLRHEGREYRVHMSGRSAFVCERDLREILKAARSTATLDVPENHLKTIAMKDLASRLGVPEEQISVASSREVLWSDASLGCPAPGQQYAQIETEGYVFELRYRERTYSYHSDLQHAIPCPAIERR